MGDSGHSQSYPSRDPNDLVNYLDNDRVANAADSKSTTLEAAFEMNDLVAKQGRLLVRQTSSDGVVAAHCMGLGQGQQFRVERCYSHQLFAD